MKVTLLNPNVIALGRLGFLGFRYLRPELKAKSIRHLFGCASKRAFPNAPRGHSLLWWDRWTDAVTAAVSAGATAVASPVERDWGGYSGYFADPEGHRWEIG